jgi:hypothetical protein
MAPLSALRTPSPTEDTSLPELCKSEASDIEVPLVAEACKTLRKMSFLSTGWARLVDKPKLFASFPLRKSGDQLSLLGRPVSYPNN